IRLLARLAGRPLWLAGIVLGAVAYGLQALALAFGPLSLVAPIVATDLLFALPVAARYSRPLRAGDWLGCVLAARGDAPLPAAPPPAPGPAGSPAGGLAAGLRQPGADLRAGAERGQAGHRARPRGPDGHRRRCRVRPVRRGDTEPYPAGARRRPRRCAGALA